ncbi:MAG: ATP-binding protein [Methanobrevibacter sp.]|nr:ATP-binding protein [Candidatus Methanoflexus mossambicus]
MTKKSKFNKFHLAANFDKSFLGSQLKNPENAIMELVANSYDAKATEVKIDWPEIEGLCEGEIFTVSDNGEGIDPEEFEEIWGSVGFDKRVNGNKVLINESIDRSIIGKNGRGRLGLFGFSDHYEVISYKNENKSKFKIKKCEGRDVFAATKVISSVKNDSAKETGLVIKCPIYRNYVSVESIKNNLSIRFGADPHFKIYINNNELKLLDLEEFDKKSFEFEGETLYISQIPREKYNKKMSQYQIVWWVNKRAAEVNKWKDLEIPIDGKNNIENKFIFSIITDFLEDDVTADWNGFENNDKIKRVKEFVKDKIMIMSKEYLTESQHAKKIKAIKRNEETLKKLNPISQQEVGKAIDTLLNECSLNNTQLEKVVSIVASMGNSNKKNLILTKLSEMNTNDWDKLGEILEKWTIEDAYTVLDELYWRLALIQTLEDLSDSPTTDELHQLQPIFENGLWIFGAEYEGPGIFTSNKSLKNVLKEILKIETSFEGDKKRPDLVTTSNGDIFSITGSDKTVKGKVVGYETILVIELKRGDSTIGDNEINQAKSYAKKIRAHGKILNGTNIDCYVLGSKLDSENEEEETVGNTITLYPRTYDTIIREAKNRTHRLMDKIKEIKGINNIGDPEIDEVMKQKKNLYNF